MKNLLALAASGLILVSCNTKEEEKQPQPAAYTPPLEITPDGTDLSSRIVYSDDPIMLSGKRGAQSATLTKKADILPNTLDGYTLSATGVDARTQGNKSRVFLSFHTRGEEYGGEILILNNSNPDQPVILQSLTDHDADYNDITVGQEFLRVWVAGDRSVDASGYTNTNGAVASKFWLNNNKTFDQTPFFEEAPLLGYSGNSMTRVANAGSSCPSQAESWMTSGSNGEVRVVIACDIAQNIAVHQRVVDNAKHFDYDGNYGVLLRGINDTICAIDVYDLTNRYSYTTYLLPFDVTYLGKNGVDVVGSYAYLALGDDGVVKVDLSNGNVMNQYDYPNGSGYANSVVATASNIYVANGSDGMVVLDSNMTFLGRYDGGGSCNYIDKVGSYLYVANGKTGGFMVIKEN